MRGTTYPVVAMPRLLVPLALLAALLLVGWFVASGDGGREPVGAATLPSWDASAGERATATLGDAPAQLATDAESAARLAAQVGEATSEGEDALAAPSSNVGSLLVRAVRTDGTAVVGVAIVAQPSRWRGLDGGAVAARTDEDGCARFAALEPGQYKAWNARGPSKDATVLAGQEVELVLEFKRTVDVQGVVVSAAGQPVPNADVWLVTWRKDWLGATHVARADADGAFFARDIGTRYSLGATARGLAPSEPVDLELLDTTRSPAEMRLVMAAGGGGGLVGHVRAPSGAPIAGAQVACGKVDARYGMRQDATSEEFWGPRATVTDERGEFAFEGLAAGVAPLSVLAQGFPIVQVDVEVAAGSVARRDVTLFEGLFVEGTVLGADGEPIADALVLQLDAPFVDPFPNQGPTDRGAPFPRPRVRSDAEGRYRLGPLAPSSNVARPDGDVHLYAASGTSYWDADGADFRGATQVTLHGGSRDVLRWDPTLTLGHRIFGRVTYSDGAPMKSVFVSARTDDRARDGTVDTDDDGRFSIPGLEDRAYTVSVQLWDAPPDSPPLQQLDVWPSETPLALVAEYPSVRKEDKATVSVRIADDAQRLDGNGRIGFATGGTTYFSSEKDGVFQATVEPGNYRALILLGDSICGMSEPFDLAPGEVRDVGVVRTVAPGTVEVRVVRGDLAQPLFVHLKAGLARQSRRVTLAPTETQCTFEGLLPCDATVTVVGVDIAPDEVHVTIRPGVTATVDIAIQASASDPPGVQGGSDR